MVTRKALLLLQKVELKMHLILWVDEKCLYITEKKECFGKIVTKHLSNSTKMTKVDHF